MRHISTTIKRIVVAASSLRLSRKPRVQISQNFLHMLPVIAARFFSDDNGIRYVLPFLITSCFQIMESMDQNQVRSYV